MWSALLWRHEGLHSRTESIARLQTWGPGLCEMLCLVTRPWLGRLQKARHRLYRVQVQILLLGLSVVLLGKHALLRALPQKIVQWRLCEQIQTISITEMPGQRKMPAQDWPSTKWNWVLTRLRDLQEWQLKRQELLKKKPSWGLHRHDLYKPSSQRGTLSQLMLRLKVWWVGARGTERSSVHLMATAIKDY